MRSLCTGNSPARAVLVCKRLRVVCRSRIAYSESDATALCYGSQILVPGAQAAARPLRIEPLGFDCVEAAVLRRVRSTRSSAFNRTRPPGRVRDHPHAGPYRRSAWSARGPVSAADTVLAPLQMVPARAGPGPSPVAVTLAGPGPGCSGRSCGPSLTPHTPGTTPRTVPGSENSR